MATFTFHCPNPGCGEEHLMILGATVVRDQRTGTMMAIIVPVRWSRTTVAPRIIRCSSPQPGLGQWNVNVAIVLLLLYLAFADSKSFGG